MASDLRSLTRLLFLLCLHNSLHCDGGNQIHTLQHNHKRFAVHKDDATYIKNTSNLNMEGQGYAKNRIKVGNIYSDSQETVDKINTTKKPGVQRIRRSHSVNCKKYVSCTNMAFIREPMCKCDDACSTYNDCCLDANIIETVNNTEPLYECRRIKTHRYLWMVASCPATFMDKEIVQKCMTFSVEAGSPDPYQVIPVHSIKHRQIFQNRYCAMCNNVNLSQDLSVTEFAVLEFENGCKNVHSRDENEFLLYFLRNEMCKVEYSLSPSALNEARPCFSPIDTCSQFFNYSEDKSMIDKCENGPYALVSSKFREQTYLNEHCFKCNQDPNHRDDMSCGPFLPPFIIDMLPLRVILDVSYVEQVVNIQSTTLCKSDEVFDSVSSTCRRVYCGTDQIYLDGRCKDMVVGLRNYVMNFSFSIQTQPSISPMNYNKKDAIFIYMGSLHNQRHLEGITQVTRLNFTQIESSKHCSILFFDGQVTHLNARSKALAIEEMQKYLMSTIFDPKIITIDGLVYRLSIIDSNSITICPPTNQSITPNLLIKFKPQTINLNQIRTCPYIKLSSDDISLLQIENSLLLTSTNDSSNSTEYSICLENFKVMDRSKQEVGSLLSLLQIEVVLTYGVFAFSFLSGVFFLVLYIMNPNIRTLPAKTISNLVLCTVLVQINYVIGIGVTELPTFCKIIGIIIHYLWLCNFAWSVICAVHMYRVFRKIQLSASAFKSTTLLKYMVFGYGLPVIYVGIFLAGHVCECFPLDIEYGGKVCFLNSNEVIIYAIDLPVSLSLLVNIALFIGVTRKIRNQTILQNSMSKKERNNFMICLRIVSVMNFSWIIGMVAKWSNLQIFWLIFTIINGLQGFFLLLSFMNWKNVVETFKTDKKNAGTGGQKTGAPIYDSQTSTNHRGNNSNY